MQSASVPQRWSAFSSSRLTPETFQIRIITKTGLINEMNCPSFRLEPANIAAPIHTTISPAQLGCRDTDHKPTLMYRPLFSGFELHEYFWQSAVTSVTSPIAHRTSPMISSHSREPYELRKGSSVISTRRGLIVKRTHSPCMNQTKKNLTLDSLISLNLLSYPRLRILMKRKRERRRAHIPTMHAAAICCQVGSWLEMVAIRVMEMQVMPPVRSKKSSVWKISAKMKPTICTAKEQADIHQKSLQCSSYRDLYPATQLKPVATAATTTIIANSLNIRTEKLSFQVDLISNQKLQMSHPSKILQPARIKPKTEGTKPSMDMTIYNQIDSSCLIYINQCPQMRLRMTSQL